MPRVYGEPINTPAMVPHLAIDSPGSCGRMVRETKDVRREDERDGGSATCKGWHVCRGWWVVIIHMFTLPISMAIMK